MMAIYYNDASIVIRSMKKEDAWKWGTGPNAHRW